MTPLAGKQMVVNPKDGQMYCVDHGRSGGSGDNKGGVRPSGGCGGCGRAISPSERSLTAINSKWHPACFACEKCKKPLEGKQVVVHEERPYCEEDHGSLFASQCAACDKAIGQGGLSVESDGVTVSFHPTCFRCTTCSKHLKNAPFFLKNGNKLYCEPHAQ